MYISLIKKSWVWYNDSKEIIKKDFHTIQLKGLKMLKKKLLILFVIAFASSAYADCQYNGIWYDEGTVMGPYVCVNGEWIRG